MIQFIEQMLDCGIAEADIRMMTATVPRQIVGA
jgi:hypothetical protein